MSGIRQILPSLIFSHRLKALLNFFARPALRAAWRRFADDRYFAWGLGDEGRRTHDRAGLPEGGCGLHRANRLRAVRQKAFYRPGYSL